MTLDKTDFLEWLDVVISQYSDDLQTLEKSVDHIVIAEKLSTYDKSQLEWELTHAMHNYQELLRDLRRLTRTLEEDKLNAG